MKDKIIAKLKDEIQSSVASETMFGETSLRILKIVSELESELSALTSQLEEKGTKEEGEKVYDAAQDKWRTKAEVFFMNHLGLEEIPRNRIILDSFEIIEMMQGYYNEQCEELNKGYHSLDKMFEGLEGQSPELREELTFEYIKNEILKSDATSEYKHASIIILRMIFQKNGLPTDDYLNSKSEK